MNKCVVCGREFYPTFAAQRYCWDCWERGAATPERRRDEYGVYLGSRDWRLFRAYRIALAGGRCECCGTRVGLQGHHLTYERRGHELLEDVASSCRGCHDVEHDIEPEELPVAAGRVNITNGIVAVAQQAVIVKTLKIDGASLSLVVYRQLPQRPLVTYSGEFAGQPWGVVNVCPSRECPTQHPDKPVEHRHVVWQDDGQLFRDVCEPPAEFHPTTEHGEELSVLAAADTWQRWIEWSTDYTGDPVAFTMHLDGLPAVECCLPFDRELRRAVRETAGKSEPPPCTCTSRIDGEIYHYGCGVTWREAQELLEEHAAKFDDEAPDSLESKVWSDRRVDTPFAVVAERISDEVAAQHESHHERCERWQEIKALPQLFLGVS